MEARLDALTGLVNRRGWNDAVDTCLASKASPVSVIVADLDDLGRVNDSEGHAAGNRLLVAAARCLSTLVRGDDVVARASQPGGHEPLTTPATLGRVSTDRDHWFEDVADHLGGAYLRYSFTKGTGQEVDFLIAALDLAPGMRVIDVGCGPGRHAYALAERGIEVLGIDVSQRFVDLAESGAPPGATFRRLDARDLPFDGEFDVAICLCQGAFGLMTADGHDETVLAGIARALRPGGRLALSAFSAYFVMKHWEGVEFDAATGVTHERTEIRDPQGASVETSLWTGCYTPRELRLLCRIHGFQVDSLSSVDPGRYGLDAPTAETAEFLVLATRRDRTTPEDGW
ncbi:MAG: methyltransferase domain-containing protein [Ilumatobacteraceae bacterium]